MPQGQVGLEAMHVDGAYASCQAVQLGVVPGNRERDGSIKQHIEIVAVLRELPEVFAIEHQPVTQLLLQAGVELVPFARLQRDGRLRAKDILSQSADSGRAG